MTKIRQMQIRLVAIAIAGILLISLFTSCTPEDDTRIYEKESDSQYGVTQYTNLCYYVVGVHNITKCGGYFSIDVVNSIEYAKGGPYLSHQIRTICVKNPDIDISTVKLQKRYCELYIFD